MNRAEKLMELARAASARIATAESCTGGLIAAAVTDVPGSSDIFDRGFVVYSNAAKHEMLGVRPDSIAAHGAVSEQVAREMVDGAILRSGATVAASVTGIAGPGGNERKPEGRVCFGIARLGHPTRTRTVEFGAIGRDSVRQSTVDHALDLLIEAIEHAQNSGRAHAG